MNRTYSFTVFFLTAKLHELTAKMQERMGRVPHVLVSRGRRIDVLAEADTLL